MQNKFKILLIITGSIAAYKSLDLIRLLKSKDYIVNCVLTNCAKKFVTELSVASLTNVEIFDDLFKINDDGYMDHIKLSRDANLVVVAPASANIISKLANGIADDLASTTLLASNKQVLMVPAMNNMMWQNKAVQRNYKNLMNDGVKFLGPVSGTLACGEYGLGKMADIDEIVKEIDRLL